jgi:methionine-rich copper-binding protein CopC
MDTSSSNPGPGQNANLKENIVLSFNEVVQAGAGKFQLWSRDSTDALAFEIDVAAVSGSSPTRTLATSGNNMMAGSSISITPKALCTGTPSCAKLTHGTTYYLKTDRAGVLRDVIGNPLATVNTRSGWYWVGKSNTDNTRPEVSFVGGYSTGSTTLVGYVFFSEQVTTNSGTLSIIDCGSDLVCSTSGDNAAALTDATVVYGDGTAGQDYGMMKFTKAVPTNNRRYKISVPSALVKDVIESGSGVSALASNTVYSFYAAVGTIPTTSGGAAPVINNYSPAISSTVITTSTDIVLHFNEDVQSGTSGTLSLCLNSDADDDGTPKCTAGDLSDLNDATASYSAVTIDRRSVTIPLAKDLKIGQKLYVLMPPGFVRDATTSSTAVATVETSGYAFTVKDLDTIKPTLDWSTTTTVTSGSVTLYFSEAVQASSALGGANVTVYGTNADVYDISSTVSGNKVTIAKSSWTQGAKYYLDMSADSFTDLAGNTLSASIAGSSYEFTISSDTTISPALPTLVPTDETTTIDQYDVLSVKFEEVVQKGTGKISIYSGAGSMAGTTSGTILVESDIASLPLVSYAESGAVKNKLVIAPPGKMIAGGEYALRMPSTAIKDAAGNLFSLLDVMRTTTAQTYSTNGGWGFTVTTRKDYTAPSIAAAVIGAGGSPNPAFTSGNTITMYFSETVQLGTTGSVYLAGSTGGNLCSSGGACTTSSCTSACSFTAGTVTKTLSTLTLSGSKVTAEVPTLQAGSGYKLQIHKEKFKDVAGTLMAADVDGETDSAKYILKQVAAATDSTGPAHSTTGTPPALTAAYPTNGAKMVPPSSTVTIQFNENVQAGSGNINVGSVGVAVSDCTFSASTIVCDPAGDLGRNTLYSVSYSASVIKDAAGNTATSTIGSTNSKLEFTTIDLDYMAPTMTSVGGTSYAVRRLYKTPYDPANAAANVAKGTVVTMTFSETVQAGTGTLSIGTKTVDMGGTLTGSVYFSGSTAYVDICSSGLSAGATASVTTSQIGAFKDTSGQPLAHIASGYSFGVIADDTEAPTIYQYVPKIDTTTADDNPSTDITLYFSEAVQAAATKKVTVNGGSDVIIPVDNANPDKGSVTVSAQMVVIDPFDDFSYDKTVAVKAESGSFKDLYDNTFNGFTGATDYQFAIPAFAFTASRTSNASNTPLPLMDGAMAFWPNSSMMIIYGGGASCSNTLYTSTTGATWIEKTTSGPAVTYASSALDGSGCIWMMGGQCTGANTATIYKTCDGGLSWPALPIPSVVPSGTWPEAMSGHAIAIVGGWTLVVVDSVGGKVYTALDTAAATMKLVASTVPFASRKDPMLQATSDNKLYLMGGHNCNDATCSNNAAFTDVWMSTEVTTAGLTSEVGATWTCQTANYDAALTSTYTKGIGRYVSSVITLDDTLWLMGGHVPNTTTGLNTVYTSYAGPLDLSLATTVYAQYPLATATGLLKSTAVTMYFTEDVLAGTGTITVTDLGNDVTAGGTTANADAAITITTAFSRQMLTITPSAALKTSHKYTVALGDGSVKDLAGNTFTSFTSFDFTVTTDGAAPTFSSASPSGASVGPATNILLTTSEAVAKGTGAITVSCATGANYTADISTATIVTDKVFFPSPGLLTDGQLYTISAPAGLLVDLVGNSNAAAASIGTFTVLSGTTSSAADGYRGDMFAAAVAGSTNATADTTAPTFVSMYPPAGATDVPSSNTSATMFFSEPVKFNASGFISIVNSSSKVVASINLTKDVDVISTVYNGAKLDLGKVTGFTMAKGAAYTISVPAGILTDFAGNAVAAASKTFTTLAGTADTTAPSVLMTSPASGSTGNLGSMTTVSLWFSEDITPVSGSVTVKLGGTSLAMGVTSSNVTVSGSTLSATVFAGSMNSAGTWNVLVPAGSLKGSDGNHFTGVNDTGSFPSYYSFGVVAADAVKPTLTTADILPAKETAPTYTLGTSDSFKLVFSETVQAGTGAVSFKASYTSPTVVAPTSSEVFFSGTTAVVSPSSDLMAGEIYSMLIDGAAFTDVQGNAMAALTSGFTVSTAPIIKFAKVGTKHFDSYSFFNGERYGSAACVAPNNDVFMVGGKNGTAGSTAMLNDVWKLVTQRDINCASSYGAKTACSATTCTGGALGTSTATSTIWKIPSAGGLKCMSSSGAMTMMGQTVATRTENCPCPTCDTAPDGSLVANILDAGSYLTTYTPVSVGGTVDLKCGLGYNSNGSSFSCVYSTPYAGVFATPYPTCDPDVTTTTVPTTAAPAPAPVVSSNVSTAAPTTTRVVNLTTFTIKSALTLSFASLPENVTAASLAADTAFVSNVAGSIASGLGVDLSMITITKIELITARRLEDEQRRLQGVKLKIEYELVTTDASVATAVQETLSDPTKTSAFTDAFSTALVEKEAASGRTIAVAEISSEAPVVTSVTEVITITEPPPAAPGAPAETPAETAAPTPATPAGTPAPTPAPAKEEEEEESDNGAVIGGVVGGVVGLGVLGGAVYAFKKKSAQE